jgi:hypothetical protein
MRIHDDRYHRERLRFHVALRFIRLEARTHTIRYWTGLTDDRIRKLYHSYLADTEERAVPRHRGKSPQRAATFLRSTPLREQTALLASLYRLLGLLSGAPAAASDALPPTLRRAELLCQAYEVYRSLLPEAGLSFEHAVFLLRALTRADELICSSCRDCSAVVVIDRWSIRSPRCSPCAGEAAATAADAPCSRRPATAEGNRERRLAASWGGLQDFGEDERSSERERSVRAAVPAAPQ